MPSTQGITRYDKYLSRLAVAWPTGNLIGKLLAPVAPVDSYSDKIFVDGDDAINKVNDLAEGVESARVDFTTGTPYSYRTSRHALHAVVTQKEVRNADDPAKPRERAMGKLTNRINIKHELAVAALLTSTSYVTNYYDVGGASANYRLDGSGPTLENDIVTAQKSIYANSGMIANVIVIPYEAAIYAAKLSFIKDSLIYTGRGMEYVSGDYQGQLRQTFGLPPMIKGMRVIVSTGRVNTAMKGQTKSVSNPWGKNIIIGYVPDAMNTDMMFGVLTAEHSPFSVQSEAVSDPVGEKILVDWDYDIVQGNFGCFYLLKNEIA